MNVINSISIRSIMGHTISNSWRFDLHILVGVFNKDIKNS